MLQVMLGEESGRKSNTGRGKQEYTTVHQLPLRPACAPPRRGVRSRAMLELALEWPETMGAERLKINEAKTTGGIGTSHRPP